jgi:hypothetical protein
MTIVSPPIELGVWVLSSVSTEPVLDLDPGTARKLPGASSPLFVGEDTLCGEIGLISDSGVGGRRSDDIRPLESSNAILSP